jgi:hypothetical protein
MALITTISMNPLVMGISQIVVYGSIALLPILMLEYSFVDRMRDRFRSGRSFDPDETFDFIVGKGLLAPSMMVVNSSQN